MDGDLGRRSEGRRLKAHAEPAVTVFLAGEAARRNGVGEDKELRGRTALGIEPLDQEIEFVVEHFDQPLAAHVPLARAIDSVAEGHVVGGHGLGNGSSRPADTKQPARDLLASANFGERAIGRRIEVDLERLLMRIACLGGHGFLLLR